LLQVAVLVSTTGNLVVHAVEPDASGILQARCTGQDRREKPQGTV
jgi:hypothetical protein